MLEHRKQSRVPVRLEVKWNGWDSSSPDVTSDVSLGGCYIESLNPVFVGEVLNLGLRLPTNETVLFRCEVRYHQPTIGFGIKFLELSVSQRAALMGLIAYRANPSFVGQAA